MNLPTLTPGKTTESPTLDFKSVHWAKGDWQRELAKDVAGLANAYGGWLVVGATEKNEVLEAFIDPKLPKKWEQGFETVLASRCIPEPLTSTLLVALGGTGVEQLVIRVEPSEDYIVIRDPGDGTKAMAMPVRRGTQTGWTDPRRMIEMINDPYRRWKIRLTKLKSASKTTWVRIFHDDTNRGFAPFQAFFTVVEVREDVVKLRSHKDWLLLPYTYVDALWRESDAEAEADIYRLKVQGFVKPRSKPDDGHLVLRPPPSVAVIK